jgi:hypothetical protein
MIPLQTPQIGHFGQRFGQNRLSNPPERLVLHWSFPRPDHHSDPQFLTFVEILVDLFNVRLFPRLTF